MYRNYMRKHCNCCNCNMNDNTEHYMEASCSDVCNAINMPYDDCECGYDEYNVFPESPVLRSKLCTNPKNE